MLFSILSVIVFSLTAYFIPKQLTKSEIYTTSLFAYALSNTADLVLSNMYHFYHYFDKRVQYLDIVTMIGIYPAINIIFLNLYPNKKRYISKVLYITGWTIFAITYEWVAIHTEFFNYSGWKLWYSGLIYPGLFIILLLNLKFIRWFHTQSFAKQR